MPFLLIPPIDDSLGPLKASQWVLLFVSFVVSLALFFLIILLHGWIEVLSALALGLASMPMQVYAMNRRGRIVGTVFVTMACGYLFYRGWDRLEQEYARNPLIVTILFALCCWACWISGRVAKLSDESLKMRDSIAKRIETQQDDDTSI